MRPYFLRPIYVGRCDDLEALSTTEGRAAIAAAQAALRLIQNEDAAKALSRDILDEE